MSTYLIIGDVHGQLETLKRVIAKAPDHERRIYVGDLIDRGPACIETLKFVMDDVANNGAICLYGNHEHMMLQSLHVRPNEYGEIYQWLQNGGKPTFEGFKALSDEEQFTVTEFLHAMPMYVEGPGFIVSHAPLRHKNVEDLMSYLDRGEVGAKDRFVWNRNGIKVWPDHLQIHGHNGEYQEYRREDDEMPFAYCIDDTQNGNICALHYPTMTVISQSFMEDEPIVN